MKIAANGTNSIHYLGPGIPEIRHVQYANTVQTPEYLTSVKLGSITATVASSPSGGKALTLPPTAFPEQLPCCRPPAHLATCSSIG